MAPSQKSFTKVWVLAAAYIAAGISIVPASAHLRYGLPEWDDIAYKADF